jgi:hypothetical protein
MTFLRAHLPSLLHPLTLSCLLAVAGCDGPVAAVDAAPVADAGADAALTPDAAIEDDASTPDAAIEDDASVGITSCLEGALAIAHEEDGVQALGLAPLGDGWAVIFEARSADFLVRLAGDGTAIGDPIPFQRAGGSRRAAIGMRALSDGVLVRSGSGARFFLADGSEPFLGTSGLAPLILGPSDGASVVAISGNDVVRITRGDDALVVERFASGLDLSLYEEPTDGYITSRSMGVSADGCLALADLTFSYETPSTLRTVPVIPGAACADVTHSWASAGSFGVFDSLEDGRFVTIAGLYPTPEVSRNHVSQLVALGGEDVAPQGETFGIPLSYGVRAAIASAPDRTIVGTVHASGYGESQVWLWRATTGTPEAITSDGRSESSGIYLAYSPTLDRVAAVYGTDSTGYTHAEHTLGLRCDL